MTRLVKYEFEDGGSVLVEEMSEGTHEERRAGRGEVIETAKQKFERALDTVRPVVNAMVGRLRAVADTPDEFSVEFGFRLSAEAGAIIAKTVTEAHFKVSLTWKASSNGNLSSITTSAPPT